MKTIHIKFNEHYNIFNKNTFLGVIKNNHCGGYYFSTKNFILTDKEVEYINKELQKLNGFKANESESLKNALHAKEQYWKMYCDEFNQHVKDSDTYYKLTFGQKFFFPLGIVIGTCFTYLFMTW